MAPKIELVRWRGPRDEARPSEAAVYADDFDATEAVEVALRAWEKIKVPSSDDHIAWLANLYGQRLALWEVDMARAEPQLRRSIALWERVRGLEDWRLTYPLFALYDLLDQECRQAEAAQVLERLQRLYALHPWSGTPQPWLSLRLQALLARRAADLPRARELLERGTLQLAGQAEHADYTQSGYYGVSAYALDAGDYPGALRYFEQAMAARPSLGDELTLALLYGATRDARLPNLEREHSLRRARAGKELFVTPLPAVESCVAEPAATPTGWLYRDGPAMDEVHACVEARPKPPVGASLSLLMRVEDGSVVAAEVVGKLFELELLECVAEGVLGLPYPAPHDFNFRDASHRVE